MYVRAHTHTQIFLFEYLTRTTVLNQREFTFYWIKHNSIEVKYFKSRKNYSADNFEEKYYEVVEDSKKLFNLTKIKNKRNNLLLCNLLISSILIVFFFTFVVAQQQTIIAEYLISKLKKWKY